MGSPSAIVYFSPSYTFLSLKLLINPTITPNPDTRPSTKYIKMHFIKKNTPFWLRQNFKNLYSRNMGRINENNAK